MKVLEYDIHGLLTVRVELHRQLSVHPMIDALSEFSGSIDKPDITLRVLEGVEPPQTAVSVEYNTRLTENEIFQSGRYKVLNYSVLYSWKDAPHVSVSVSTNLKSWRKGVLEYPVIQTAFLMPLIEHELLKRKIAAVHSAGFSRDDAGALIVGRGGVFKTSLAMDLVRDHNYEFLGDDKVLVSGDGTLYSYRTFPGIFRFRKESMPDEHLSSWSKLRFLGSALREKSWVNERPIVSKLKSVVFLERGSRGISVETIGRDQARSRLLANYDIELASAQGIGGISTSVLSSCLMKHDYVFPDSIRPTQRKAHRTVIDCIADRDKYCEIIGPKVYRPQLQEVVLSKIDLTNETSL